LDRVSGVEKQELQIGLDQGRTHQQKRKKEGGAATTAKVEWTGGDTTTTIAIAIAIATVTDTAIATLSFVLSFAIGSVESIGAVSNGVARPLPVGHIRGHYLANRSIGHNRIE
jgi:hypothetical protein